MNVIACRLLVIAMAAHALSACAVGNTYDYRTAPPNLTASAARSLTVGEALERLKAGNTDRMLLATIFEWKTDTYVTVALQESLQ